MILADEDGFDLAIMSNAPSEQVGTNSLGFKRRTRLELIHSDDFIFLKRPTTHGFFIHSNDLVFFKQIVSSFAPSFLFQRAELVHSKIE